MHCWLFFHRELRRGVPEAAEVFRFQEAAAASGVTLDVLRPQAFELIVDSRDGWSAVYEGRRLAKPDLIIPRTGSETSGSNREQFHDLANLLDGAQSGANFIFQQYIKASHGRDVRLLVVHGRVVAAMLRKSTDGGFKSNISLGGVGAALNPPPGLAELAVRAANVLQLDVAGIDILFDEDGYRICEANSAPGFQGLEKACDISVPDETSRQLALGWACRCRGPTDGAHCSADCAPAGGMPGAHVPLECPLRSPTGTRSGSYDRRSAAR
jgi:hypothetical protein